MFQFSRALGLPSPILPSCLVTLLSLVLSWPSSSFGQPPRGGQQQFGVVTPVAPGNYPRILPRPFPELTPQHLSYIDEVLKYWEQKSKTIQRYRCQFRRWEYDFVFGPQEVDPNTNQRFAKTFETGEIKYMSPDKGLFKVTEILHYQRADAPNNPPTWTKVPGQEGEHWVCDGKSIYWYDYRKQTLYEQPLPADMQGKTIADGPLPFLFGADKEKIKQRYWIRVVTPSTVKNEYWLEIYPKLPQDAQDFSRIVIIIDEEQWLPLALQVFPRGFDPQKPSWISYMFEKREVNWSQLPDQLRIFSRAFYQPEVPAGWKKEVQPFGAPIGEPAAQQAQGPRPQPTFGPPAPRR